MIDVDNMVRRLGGGGGGGEGVPNNVSFLVATGQGVWGSAVIFPIEVWGGASQVLQVII